MSDETETDLADEVSVDGASEAALDEETPAKKKMAGKTLVLFIILPALLLLGGGGGAAMMLLGGGKADAAPVDSGEGEKSKGKTGKKDEHAKKDDQGKADDHGKPEGGDGKSDAHGDVKTASHSEGNGAVIQIGKPGNPSFYTMPKILVTVSNGNGGRSQLLLKLTLESADPGVFDKVDSVLPRITDQFQMFLREMRVDDLSGSAGDYRIRRELLRRVNLSLGEDRIDAVLIEEFIVQ